MQFLDFLKESEEEGHTQRDQNAFFQDQEDPTLVSEPHPAQCSSLSELFSCPPSPSHYFPTSDHQKKGLSGIHSQLASPFYSTVVSNSTRDVESSTLSWSTAFPSAGEDSHSGLSIMPVEMSSPEEDNLSNPFWSLRQSLEKFQRQEAYSSAVQPVPGESMTSITPSHPGSLHYTKAQRDVQDFFESRKSNLCTVLIFFPKVAQKSYGNEKR